MSSLKKSKTKNKTKNKTGTKYKYENRDIDKELNNCDKFIKDKINKCNPSNKYSGHGKIVSANNGKVCIKQTRRKESQFYLDKCGKKYENRNTKKKHIGKKHPICKFIPQMIEICPIGYHRDELVLENLIDGFNTPIVMDIKIGYHTVYFAKKNIKNPFKLLQKKISHPLKDSKILIPSLFIGSYSKIYGYKVVSVPTININRNKLKSMNPLWVLQKYFKYDDSGKCLNSINKELNKLNQFIQSNKFDLYAISSSVFFVYEGNNKDNNCRIKVKLIDMPYVDEPKNDKENEFKEEFRLGMKNLVKLFFGYKKYVFDIKKTNEKVNFSKILKQIYE